jgi:hypothetical protein
MAFGFDEYIKPYYNFNAREIGFRVGRPILDWEIAKFPGSRPTWTAYNRVEVHGFSLESIASDGLVIRVQTRWKRFTKKPFVSGTIKTGETNCNSKALTRVSATNDHRIRVGQPLVMGVDCTSSGFDLVSVSDYMVQGLTSAVTGGTGGFGLFDVLGGIGALAYDFAAFFRDASIAVTDPIDQKVLSDHLFPYVKRIYDLDDAQNEVYLSAVRYDPMGVWFIFSYPAWANGLAESIVGLLSTLEGWCHIQTIGGAYLSPNNGDRSPGALPAAYGWRVHTVPNHGPPALDYEKFQLDLLRDGSYHIMTVSNAYLSPNDGDRSPGTLPAAYGWRVHTVPNHGAPGLDRERFRIVLA